MTRYIKEYDHLNNSGYEDGEIVQRISLDDLAERVLTMNYGLIRFLSALNRVVHDPTKNAGIAYQKEDVEAIVEAFENLPRFPH